MSNFRELKLTVIGQIAVPAHSKDHDLSDLTQRLQDGFKSVLLEMRRDNVNMLPINVTTSLEEV
jgi:hypothetical protein